MVASIQADSDDDGLRLITGTDVSALIWNLDTDTWADLACRVAGSNLTADEWERLGPRDNEPHAICPQYPLP